MFLTFGSMDRRTEVPAKRRSFGTHQRLIRYKPIQVVRNGQSKRPELDCYLWLFPATTRKRSSARQSNGYKCSVLKSSISTSSSFLLTTVAGTAHVNSSEAMPQRTRRIRLILFARNFGHQIAVTAGIDAARGDAVVLMDADLQDSPEVVHEMIGKWRQGYDVVYGTRTERPGESLFKQSNGSRVLSIVKRSFRCTYSC